MSWRAEPDALRTIDSEKNWELKVVGGGSDGGQVLTIGSRHELITIRAYVEESLEDDRPLRERRFVKWRVETINGALSNLSIAETREVIRSALLAFKYLHGRPPQASVSVDFSNYVNAA